MTNDTLKELTKWNGKKNQVRVIIITAKELQNNKSKEERMSTPDLASWRTFQRQDTAATWDEMDLPNGPCVCV